jgi:hypothetical protein
VSCVVIVSGDKCEGKECGQIKLVFSMKYVIINKMAPKLYFVLRYDIRHEKCSDHVVLHDWNEECSIRSPILQDNTCLYVRSEVLSFTRLEAAAPSGKRRVNETVSCTTT